MVNKKSKSLSHCDLESGQILNMSYLFHIMTYYIAPPFLNLTLFIYPLAGQHIKKCSSVCVRTRNVQRLLLNFLFSLSLALLSLWGLLQICTYTANDSLSKHSQVRIFFSHSEWFSSNDLKECGRDGEIHFQTQSLQSIAPFSLIGIIIRSNPKQTHDCQATS